MTKLDTAPYRGTKDLFPERERVRQYIFNMWREVSASYGYEEYSGPLVEPLQLYASKSSEEIVSQQLYRFEDKSGREIAIRPEMTPTVARMVAATRGKYQPPIRWFCIETCMRYERPQRGRLRQFDQFNLDILGGEAFGSDFEALSTIPDMLFRLGAKEGAFKVKLNHRVFVEKYLGSKLSVGTKNLPEVLRLIDAFPKMSEEDFTKKTTELGLSSDDVDVLKHMMKSSHTELSQAVDGEIEELNYLSKIIDDLNALWGKEVFEFDAAIMRGFDYYTGIIFEVVDCSPKNNRALFGGGRYDNLVEAFGCEALSGVGYGVSEVSIYNFLDVHGLLEEMPKPVDVVASCIHDDSGEALLSQVLKDFRLSGLNCERVLGANKIKKALKMSGRLGAKAMVIIGPEEAEKQVFKLKNLDSSNEKEVKIADASRGAELIAELS